jgi:hypothetical protein
MLVKKTKVVVFLNLKQIYGKNYKTKKRFSISMCDTKPLLIFKSHRKKSVLTQAQNR